MSEIITKSTNIINQFLDKNGAQLIISKLLDLIDTELSKIKTINTSYSELKNLRDNKKLMPGWKYRINDYKTTTTQNNTIAAEHKFDIIVEAISNDSLSENAKADYHIKDDTDYFYKNKANLSAWELKYTIDNDSDKFLWADEDEGTGIIYYMKDEWGNECSYDFKNIMMKRPVSYIGNDKSTIATLYTYEYQGEFKGPIYSYNNSPYFYTFSYRNLDNTIVDYSVIKNIKLSCCNNSIASKFDDYTKKQMINIIYFVESAIDNNQYALCIQNKFDYDCTHIVINGGSANLNIGQNCKWLDFGYICSNITTGAQVEFMKFGNYSCDSFFKGYTKCILFTDKAKTKLKTLSGVNINFNNYSEKLLYITSDNDIYNLNIAAGVNNGSIKDPIEIETSNYYETKIARTSLSELKIYCEADTDSKSENKLETEISGNNITFTANAIVDDNNLILKGDNIYVNTQNKKLFIN